VSLKMISGAFNRWTLVLPKQTNASPPKAIIVLIGWWGANSRHLNKYVELYHQDRNHSCITLSGIVDSRTLAFKNDRVLRNFAFQGLVEVSCLLQKYEELPIMIHLFSNGGGFVWEHMLQILKERPFEEIEKRSRNHHPNLNLISKNLQGQIFDSAPAYPSVETFIAALKSSGTIRNFFLLKVVEVVALCLYHAENFICNWIFRKENRLLAYWNTLLKSSELFSRKQGFVYSSMDHVTDVVHLENFIRCRKAQGTEVSVLKFDDSSHVLHYRNHPVEYKKFVGKFVKEISNI